MHFYIFTREEGINKNGIASEIKGAVKLKRRKNDSFVYQ